MFNHKKHQSKHLNNHRRKMEKQKSLLQNTFSILLTVLFILLLFDIRHKDPLFLESFSRQMDAFTQAFKNNETKTLSELYTISNSSQPDEAITIPEGETLRIDYIDVGQGDCTLIRQGEHAMLFDCAPDEKGTFIQNYLQKCGVDTLEYVIGSHPDEDHIGSMDVIVEKFNCRNIFMPSYAKDTRTYDNVQQALDYKGYHPYMPEIGDSFPLGDATFTILGPVNTYTDSNNNSICIRLTYGSTSFLFTGDAEEDAEADLISNGQYLKSNVFQVGHHGSRTSNTMSLLHRIMPEYAIISCGKGNDYGHPHEETLKRLENIGAEILRTDQLGTIRLESDGIIVHILNNG